jgi:hypothetical protein
MELLDNAVILIVPGAINAGLDTGLFWTSLAFSPRDRVRGDGSAEPLADQPRQGTRHPACPSGRPRPPRLTQGPARLPWRGARRADCERYLEPDHQMTQAVRENLHAATRD